MLRKITYTTNSIESLNRVLQKTLKSMVSYPTEETLKALCISTLSCEISWFTMSFNPRL